MSHSVLRTGARTKCRLLLTPSPFPHPVQAPRGCCELKECTVGWSSPRAWGDSCLCLAAPRGASGCCPVALCRNLLPRGGSSSSPGRLGGCKLLPGQELAPPHRHRGCLRPGELWALGISRASPGAVLGHPRDGWLQSSLRRAPGGLLDNGFPAAGHGMRLPEPTSRCLSFCASLSCRGALPSRSQMVLEVPGVSAMPQQHAASSQVQRQHPGPGSALADAEGETPARFPAGAAHILR